MYNPDTDLLFPPRALPALRNLRCTAWQELVSSVIMAGSGSLELISFILMMARMNNCSTCNFASLPCNKWLHGLHKTIPETIPPG